MDAAQETGGVQEAPAVVAAVPGAGEEEKEDGYDSSSSEEEDDEDHLLPEQLLDDNIRFRRVTPLSGPLDPRRMELPPDIHEWACEIKTKMTNTAETDCPCDYWCAQWALCESNLATVLDRATKLQQYREAYDIVDTYEFGSKCLTELLALFPGLFLSFSFHHADGNYVIVEDLAKFDLPKLQDPVKGMVWLRGAYFLNQILSCDLEAIRVGIVLIHECEGYDWKKNIDLKALRQIWTEFATIYPIRFKNVLNYNSGMFVNLVVSMARPFLPQEVRDVWIMGCQADCSGRLDSLYNLPNPQVAQQRVLLQMQEALKRRYQLEREFQL